MTGTAIACGAAVVALSLAGCRGENGQGATDGASLRSVTVSADNVTRPEARLLEAGPLLSGSLQAQESATLRAEVAGTVTDVGADAGQTVRRGAVLARISDPSMRDAYASARSGLVSARLAAEVARRNLTRARRLAAAGALAAQDLENTRSQTGAAEAALADARARVAAAGQRLGDLSVRAPFDGVIGDRSVSQGDVVQVGAALFTAIDLATLRLEAFVPVEELAALQVGLPVDFTVAGFRGSFRGQVERIVPRVDPASGQVAITATIPNADRRLVSGLYAEGRLVTQRRHALSLSLEAIDTRSGAPTVARIVNGRVDRVPVTLGLRDGRAGLVEVTTGLQAGDRILLRDARVLTAGTPVVIATPDGGSPDA